MAVGKASLKRAAKAAETEAEDEEASISEKLAAEETEPLQRPRKGPETAEPEKEKGRAGSSETEEEQRFQKDKSHSKNSCFSGKTSRQHG